MFWASSSLLTSKFSLLTSGRCLFSNLFGLSRTQGRKGGHGADKARGCESDTLPRRGWYGKGAGTGGERYGRDVSDVSDISSKRRTHAKVGRRKTGIYFDDDCLQFREHHINSDVTTEPREGLARAQRPAAINPVSNGVHRDLAGIESVVFYDRIARTAYRVSRKPSDHRAARVSSI